MEGRQGHAGSRAPVTTYIERNGRAVREPNWLAWAQWMSKPSNVEIYDRRFGHYRYTIRFLGISASPVNPPMLYAFSVIYLPIQTGIVNGMLFASRNAAIDYAAGALRTARRS